MRPRLALLAAAVFLVLAPLPAAAAPGSLDAVGRNPLGARGMNAGLAVAGQCAWVGSRNDAPVQVLDISNPSAPRVTGSLPSHPGSTPRELRSVPSAHLVVVLYYRLAAGPNRLDIFHWDDDCAHVAPTGSWDFGSATPHEFYLWQDPARAARVLLYTTMFASGGQELRVIDITDPSRPTAYGGWAVPPKYGRSPVHSIALSPSGATAYLSLWTGGLVVADASDFVAGRAAPVLRPLTLPGNAYRTPPGNVHSAVPLAGGGMVLTSDERYPSPFGAGCPSGPAHLVDVRDPAHPFPVAALAVPENSPAACAAFARNTWTSHNPTLTPHLAFVSWYSAGLQVFQLDDPAQPVRVAELRAAGVSPGQRDLQLGTSETMSWSYPVISAGLVYLVDINQGLVVLRYSGPHADEVAGTSLLEGNSNIHQVNAGATPSAPEGAAPSPRPPRVPAPTVVAPGGAAVPGLVLLGVALAVTAGVVGLVVAGRRRR